MAKLSREFEKTEKAVIQGLYPSILGCVESRGRPRRLRGSSQRVVGKHCRTQVLLRILI